MGILSDKGKARREAKAQEEARLTAMQGFRGEKGADGKEGREGRPGKDGKDGKSIIGPRGPQGIPGRDGIDAKELSATEVKSKLQSLTGNDRLDASAIKNLPSQTGKTIHRGGAKQFTSLTDAPTTYAGQANKVVSVKANETGLEFTTNSAGAGDVVGPASATDNAIVRYDATTGKLIQDSVVTIADTTGNVAGLGTLNTHTLPAGTDTLVGRASTDTLTNKTLTSPVINTPTGIVKGDVGLGNVDNTSDATKNAATATLTNKTVDGNNNTLTVLAASQLSGATPVANGGTGQTGATAAFDALAPTTTQGDIIYHNGTDNVRLAKGTASQVLTMNSGATAPEWATAASGSTPQFTYKPEVVVTGGVSASVSNSGSHAYGSGLTSTTGATASSYARAIYQSSVSYPQGFNGNNNFSVTFYRSLTGTDHQFFIGPELGTATVSGTAWVFTEAHYGFKIIRVAGADTTSATNADGTTETATSFTPNSVTDDQYIWHAVKTGTTNIKYYEGKTLRATHTTNLPGETVAAVPFAVKLNNANVASSSAFIMKNYTYNQDAQ